MLRAAVWPWRSATTQCSTRIRSPVEQIRPAGDVAGGEDAGHARLEIFVYRDAAVDRESRTFRQRRSPAARRTDHDEIGPKRFSILQRDTMLVDDAHGRSEMERHAVVFVQLADELPHVGAQYPFHRTGFPADDVHVDIASTQRCRDLETDEARADHHCAARFRRRGDDRPAVGQRAQVVHVREIGAGHVQAHRLGAGGEEERVVAMTTAIGEPHLRCAVSMLTTRAFSFTSMPCFR